MRINPEFRRNVWVQFTWTGPSFSVPEGWPVGFVERQSGSPLQLQW